jgi:putative flippase GtrA
MILKVPRAALVRLARFVAAGILNTAFGYSVFAAVYLVTGMHRAAIVVATMIGVVFNYFTIGRFVFAHRTLSAILPFTLGYGIILILNVIAVDLLMGAGLNALFAQLVCLPPLAILSYVVNDRLIFGRRL